MTNTKTFSLPRGASSPGCAAPCGVAPPPARPAMASSCSEQRQNLLACLADSPCVAAGRTLKECMEVEDGGCKGLRVAYFTCKRGQLDMRKRIKGNLPQHVDDTEEDNFGGRLLEIQRRKREEDEARKAHAARS